jgi:hypothetical protein
MPSAPHSAEESEETRRRRNYVSVLTKYYTDKQRRRYGNGEFELDVPDTEEEGA